MLGMTKTALLLSVAAALATAGCSSPGKRLEPSMVNQIREGETTRDEVEKHFGKPENAITGSNRRTLVIYEYGRLKPSAEPTSLSILPTPIGTVRLRTLTVLYDDADRVEKKVFHESVTPYERNMSSVSAGTAVEEADLSSIKAGRTTGAELRKRFGYPMGKTMTIDGHLVLVWHYGKAAGRFEPRFKRQSLLVEMNASDVVIDYAVAGNLSPKSRTN
jgi:outer membrane protein assembly factor BamE (lipoprotein component of BamABCDE complex)